MSSDNERMMARIDELERRLAQLEAPPKRGAGYAVVLLLGGIMAFAMSAPAWGVAQDGEKPAAQEITCKKLTVVDAKGKPRVVLAFNDAGGSIELINKSDKKIATIVTDQFGGVVRLFGNDEKRLLIIGGNNDGCQVNACDPDGNIRAFLGVDGAKEGYLSLRNSKDKTTVYVGEDDDGGLVRAYGHDGKVRAFFGVGLKGGDGLIMLHGTDGKRRHLLGSDKDNVYHSLSTDDGIIQHDIRGGKTGAYHSFFAKDGKAIITHVGASNDNGEGLIRLNTAQGKTHSYLGSNKNGTGGLILLNTPDDSSRVVIGIDGNGVGFGEGRDADNVIRRALK